MKQVSQNVSGDNENRELVSVIIPVYRVELYLAKCIDSVLGQTYHNLEIILIDDGSPDRCPYICDEYAKRDSRISVIHKENGGLSSARNAGLDIAKGKYITFVDSDDYIHPQMIERLLNIIIQSGAQIALGKVQCVFPDEKEQIVPYYNDEKYIMYQAQSAIKASYHDMCFTTAWGKLYERALFKGIQYPIGMLNEDEAVTYRLYWKCNEVAVTMDILYFYFQRDGSIMGSRQQINNIALLDTFTERMLFFKENKCYDLMKEHAIFVMNFCCDKYIRHSGLFEAATLVREKKEVRKYFVKYGFLLNLRQYIKCLMYCISPRLMLMVHTLLLKTRKMLPNC